LLLGKTPGGHEDFLFELTDKEIDHMVSQNVIPSKPYLGGASPLAFQFEEFLFFEYQDSGCSNDF
jgi:hypothetical protein